MATEDVSLEKTVWDRRSSREHLVRFLALLGAIVLFIVSWQALEVNYGYVASSPAILQDMFSRMFPPDAGYSVEIVGPMIETIHIGILGTALAIVLSLPVAYIGAENTTMNRATLLLGKGIISATRSVNTIIYALVFVVLFGPGAFAGVLAVAVRSVGFVSKLLAEAIEEIDPTQVEAVRATGANGLETLLYGVVPQVKPAFIGVATYRWDINVREATILGFVGAGGIGAQMSTQMNYFAWDNVLTILLAILVVVLFSEWFSAWARRKVR